MSFQSEGVDTIENLNEAMAFLPKDDLECGNCLKNYKRKSAYEKHITARSCKKKKIATVPSDTSCEQAVNEKSNIEIDEPGDVPPVLKQFVKNENLPESLDEPGDVPPLLEHVDTENPPEPSDDQAEDEDLEHSSDNFDDPTESSSDDEEEEGSVSNTVLHSFSEIPRNEITEMIISNIQLRAIEKAYLDMDLYRN